MAKPKKKAPRRAKAQQKPKKPDVNVERDGDKLHVSLHGKRIGWLKRRSGRNGYDVVCEGRLGKVRASTAGMGRAANQDEGVAFLVELSKCTCAHSFTTGRHGQSCPTRKERA